MGWVYGLGLLEHAVRLAGLSARYGDIGVLVPVSRPRWRRGGGSELRVKM